MTAATPMTKPSMVTRTQLVRRRPRKAITRMSRKITRGPSALTMVEAHAAGRLQVMSSRLARTRFARRPSAVSRAARVLSAQYPGPARDVRTCPSGPHRRCTHNTDDAWSVLSVVGLCGWGNPPNLAGDFRYLGGSDLA